MNSEEQMGSAPDTATQPLPPAQCKERQVWIRGRIRNVKCVLWPLVSRSYRSVANTFPEVRDIQGVRDPLWLSL